MEQKSALTAETIKQYKRQTELLTLTESALEKLYRMSDEEFEKLELYPDFDA